MKLEKLYSIIIDRKINRPTGSYVASLFAGNRDRCIQKIGEEATEVVIAAKNNNKKRQVEEITDLFFHLLIVMAKLGINLNDLYQELDKRHIKRS